MFKGGGGEKSNPPKRGFFFFFFLSQEPAHESIKIEGLIIQGIKDEIAAVSRQHVRRHQNKKTQSAGVAGGVGYIT